MVAYGTLARLTAGTRYPWPALTRRGTRGGANAALVLTGMWIGTITDDVLTPDPDGQLQHYQQVVAAARATSDQMLSAVHLRRRAAATLLAARSGRIVREIVIRPLWRIVVGHGGEGNYETGLSLSRTYGVPALPGSALKGLAAAQAAAEQASEDTMLQVFGSPRPNLPEAQQGGVVVLDAVPVSAPRLVVDVLTPHQVEYYKQVNSGTPVTVPPAEYHNPVPVRFLAVAATPFRTLLLGAENDVSALHGFLGRGLDERGLGGKTAAGYGYCTLEDVQ